MPIDPNIYTFNDGDEAYIARSTAEIDRTNRMCRDGVFDGAPKPAILAGPIHTQADAERLLPALLTCKGVAKWIGTLIEPREVIDLKMWNPADPQSDGEWMASVEGVGVIGKIRPLDRVIVRGGEEPMHPDWVRSIRDQCEAAGVPFWFDGWGEWLPIDEYSPFTHGADAGHRYEAADVWRSSNRVNDLPVLCYRVGTARSGRTLDGREHRGEV